VKNFDQYARMPLSASTGEWSHSLWEIYDINAP
jgi:hypothetical protein